MPGGELTRAILALAFRAATLSKTAVLRFCDRAARAKTWEKHRFFRIVMRTNVERGTPSERIGLRFRQQRQDHLQRPKDVFMSIRGFDHLVLTVRDVDATVRFYEQVLGMRHVLDGTRHELHFGTSKINLHRRPGEYQPAAAHAVAGSADFCLVSTESLEELVNRVRACAPIELGPVTRQGAQGPMTSIYLRDPDGNLVEIAVYKRSEH